MPAGVYKRTKEHCKKISEARKREWEEGSREIKMSFNGMAHSVETRNKIRNSLIANQRRSKHVFKFGDKPWNKGMVGFMDGERHWNWKGGKSKTVIYKRFYRIRKSLINHGDILFSTIQKVYEENIKRNGVLTCYLCYRPIKFGEDCIEHKTPFCRGGDNSIENIDVAHRKCNRLKYKMTEEEYRKEIL